MTNENEIRDHSISNTWIRVCPRCVSTQIDLHLYGRYSQQLYKCLDCDYVGIDFIQIDLPTLKRIQDNKQVALQETDSQNNSEKTPNIVIEYCCPHCGQICTEAEVQQGFCTVCE